MVQSGGMLVATGTVAAGHTMHFTACSSPDHAPPGLIFHLAGAKTRISLRILSVSVLKIVRQTISRW